MKINWKQYFKWNIKKDWLYCIISFLLWPISLIFIFDNFKKDPGKAGLCIVAALLGLTVQIILWATLGQIAIPNDALQ